MYRKLPLLFSVLLVLNLILANCAPQTPSPSDVQTAIALTGEILTAQAPTMTLTSAPTNTNVPPTASMTNAPTLTNTVTVLPNTATNTPVPSASFTSTSQVGPTIQSATATKTVPTYVPAGEWDDNGVWIVGERESGQDSNEPQTSFFFWEYGEGGTMYSSSVHALIALDNNPQTPLTEFSPAEAHDECWFWNAALNNDYIKPCYRYNIPDGAYGVAPSSGPVYALYQMDSGSVSGGPIVYAPHKPNPTKTPSVTPTVTKTITPVVTQDVTWVSTPVSNDARLSGTGCNGDGQLLTYDLNADPTASSCVRNITDQPVGSAHWVLNTKHYYMTLSVNANPGELWATYIINGFGPNVVCTLNGTQFTDGNTVHTVRVAVGNLNTKLVCTADGHTFTATSVFP